MPTKDKLIEEIMELEAEINHHKTQRTTSWKIREVKMKLEGKRELYKALTSSNKEIEELKESRDGWKKLRETLDILYDDLKKDNNNLKSQLQKKDNIIKGMNQIIQGKTLTKEQVFGKDKLQTAEKEIKRLKGNVKLENAK